MHPKCMCSNTSPTVGAVLFTRYCSSTLILPCASKTGLPPPAARIRTAEAAVSSSNTPIHGRYLLQRTFFPPYLRHQVDTHTPPPHPPRLPSAHLGLASARSRSFLQAARQCRVRKALSSACFAAPPRYEQFEHRCDPDDPRDGIVNQQSRMRYLWMNTPS